MAFAEERSMGGHVLFEGCINTTYQTVTGACIIIITKHHRSWQNLENKHFYSIPFTHTQGFNGHLLLSSEKAHCVITHLFEIMAIKEKPHKIKLIMLSHKCTIT